MTGKSLTRDELREWLNRPSPPKRLPEPEEPPPADQRDWPEFEMARVGRELEETGHG